MTIELTPEQVADGWIAHDGGECPVKARTEVEALTLGCGIVGNIAYGLRWEDHPGRVIAYRPKEPRP